MSLLPVAEAQARVLALAPMPGEEEIALAAACGHWTRRPMTARRTQPAADLSAMDGYAIRFAERPGPWRLTGESAAGGGHAAILAPGEAVRIFTGAPMPEGADTVLVQEDATVADGRVAMSGDGPARAGTHVRPRGGDFVEGALLVDAGVRLTPARIALAVSGGHGGVTVRRRPRVVLLSTGDELVAPGATTSGTQLPASNGAMLAALLAALPVEVDDRGIVGDEPQAMRAAIEQARGAELLLTIGGASVGDYDLVRPALAAAGAALDFWRVAMKPGKPLIAGRLGDGAVIGLPGNPVSAFVTAHLFVLPLLRAMLGDPSPLPRPRRAALSTALGAAGSRTEYLRAEAVGSGVRPLARQDSAGLVALAAADALIVRPPNAPAAAAGDLVEVIDLA